MARMMRYFYTQGLIIRRHAVFNKDIMKKYNIAVAGTGYVGLSIATLLAQHNHVTAVDVVAEKVDLINSRRSPIQDEYIEKYLAEKGLRLTPGRLMRRPISWS